MEAQKQQPLNDNTKNIQNQQHTVICFCYNVTIYNSSESTQQLFYKNVSDTLRSLTTETSNQFNCEINISSPEFLNKVNNLHHFKFTIVIIGPPNQAVDAKGYLMRKNPSQTESTLSLVKNLILKDNGEMKSDFKRRLDEIMLITKTSINFSKSGNVDSNLDLEIMGRLDNVDQARIQCLVALDEMSGLHSETMTIDKRLLTIIAGRKRETLNTVMKDTLTNIYFPPYLQIDEVLMAPQPNDPNWHNDPNHKAVIFITGLKANTLIAKSQLSEIAENKKRSLTIKVVVCISRKLDWLFLNHKEKLKKIMSDNATILILPKLGSSSNMLTVIGDEKIFVERSIRTLMIFICGFYVACIRRQPITQTSSAQGMYKIQQPNYNGDRSAAVAAAEYDSKGEFINNVIQNACRNSGAEIILQPQYVEVCGLQTAVKYAYESLSGTEFFRTSRDSKFQLELALEHREFINGKKNGKINKITKASSSKISFQENFNGYNMLIEIQNSSPLKSLEGLTLLEDEMPAEISFYVPESFHKRIIGVGGKNIQRIMKKYGVYVKFSNSEEFQTIGGYFENMDNVIARTPAKNAFNLNELKMSIIELITTKENYEKKTFVKIPRQHHKVVIGLQGCNIADIEKETNVQITFPDVESGVEEFVIQRGDDDEVQRARQCLLDLVPEVCEIQIPSISRAKEAIESMEFYSEVVQKLKAEKSLLDYFFYFPKTNNLSPTLRSSDRATNVVENYGSSVISILIHFNPRVCNSDHIKAIVNKFLTSKEVNLVQDKVISRVASSSSAGNAFNQQNVARTSSYDSFQHFNSKLIAPVNPSESIVSVMSSTYSLFDGANKAFEFSDPRNPKQAHSAPNLRLLFEDALYPNSSSQILNNGQPSLRSNLSESYNHMFSRNNQTNNNADNFDDDDIHHDDNFHTQFDILGETLAATSIGGLQGIQKGRNLLNPSRSMDPAVFGQGFNTNSGNPSDPSINFWSVRSKQNSNTSLIDDSTHNTEKLTTSSPQQQQQPIPRIPTDNVRGLQLSRSDPNTNKIFEEKTKQRTPSKLRQHFDAEQLKNEKSEPKRWGNIAGINPHAPSFEPSSSSSVTTFETSSSTIQIQKTTTQTTTLSYTNAVLQNSKIHTTANLSVKKN
ncbi:hypothetical protein HK099_007409 [Clydaea vesicula]|uniref:K Homology domain-containing protein n=1 Tax=Clydaea vesicula TaxID=447962 RepID=A0AAD5XWE5_9FUNG|nr:hypothetical protein HK099_007409 [Clydaea vesicula]KAJ3381564.1 hypothetical protein HDU92_005250 [Lobulomyces angularis]